MSTGRLLAWCALWGAALVVVAHLFLAQPVGWMIFAVGLSVIFVYINGVSDGITDSNPISSAFVVSVLLMSGLGLRNTRERIAQVLIGPRPRPCRGWPRMRWATSCC